MASFGELRSVPCIWPLSLGPCGCGDGRLEEADRHLQRQPSVASIHTGHACLRVLCSLREILSPLSSWAWIFRSRCEFLITQPSPQHQSANLCRSLFLFLGKINTQVHCWKSHPLRSFLSVTPSSGPPQSGAVLPQPSSLGWDQRIVQGQLCTRLEVFYPCVSGSQGTHSPGAQSCGLRQTRPRSGNVVRGISGTMWNLCLQDLPSLVCPAAI